MPTGVGNRTTPLCVGVFGPYSSSNLGDTATQIAVMANLRQAMATRHPNARVEFIGIGSDPADIARTHGIVAFDMTGTELHSFAPGTSEVGRSRKRPKGSRLLPSRLQAWICRLLQARNIFLISRQIDLLVISGGGQLDDFWGGPWGRPFELLAWTLSLRLRRRRVVVFATGVDNLSTRLGSWLCVRAVNSASYVALRDHWSADFLRGKGVKRELAACPDAAFSLPGPFKTLASFDDHRHRILACPISERAWRHAPDQSYESYLNAFVKLCAMLVEGGNDVCLSNSQSGMDIPIVDSVELRIRCLLSASAQTPARGNLEVCHANTVQDFVDIASSSSVVVASRLHGVILPLVAGTPVVAISYMRKVSQLMAEAGLSDYCVDLINARVEELLSLVDSALANRTSLRAGIASMNSRFRRELESQYDMVARLALT